MALTKRDHAAIAKVTIGEELRGTAFLVTPTLAITAAHVIGGTTAVKLEFPGHEAIDAHCTYTSEDLDWALLSCAPAPSIEPLKLHAFDRWWGEDRWDSHGYGGAYGAFGGPLSGILYSEDPLGLKCLEVKTKAEAEGFSGGPLVICGGVVGLISFVRFEKVSDALKLGYFGGVRVADILGDWPESHKEDRPTELVPLPYELALAMELADIVGNIEVAKALAIKLGIGTDPRTVAGDVARELVRRPWNEACVVVDAIGRFAKSPLHQLVDSMWVRRDAASMLAPTLAERSPGVVLRTGDVRSLRHHAMRAHGEHDRTGIPAWGQERHLVIAIVTSGESLLAAVTSALEAKLGVRESALDELLADPPFPPTIVAISAPVIVEADLAPVRERFSQIRLLWFSATSTAEVVARAAPSLRLVEPVPDVRVEQKASGRARGHDPGG